MIQKVEKDTELAQQLLAYVENCSWIEARDHIAENIRSWVFSDWETMFAAVEDGAIVGMASVMKTDYYPLPEVFPWVSSLFVSENHRGRGLSGQLIDGANRYLRDLGFPAATSPPRFSACMSALATPISGTSSTTAAAQTICLERNGDMILYFSATGNCK